jgi:hypothetical protein
MNGTMTIENYNASSKQIYSVLENFLGNGNGRATISLGNNGELKVEY